MKLVVVIPCLDEDKTIGEVVAGVPETIDGIDQIEIVVVDDGSTDSTTAEAHRAGAAVVSHQRNLGLGRAFRSGIGEALKRGADIVVNVDGDGQFDPADIPKLLAPLVSHQAHMVTASRFVNRKLVPRMPLIKRWGNRWVAWIVLLITGRRFQDVSCGFRAFSREALLRMNLFGTFTYTQETFLDLLVKGLSIVEVPVRVRGTREHGESRVASSIPRYAIRSFKIMARAAIGYHPFRFFATLAVAFLGIGLSLLGFLLWHYLQTGGFSPHIWAGFTGGSFSFLGILTLVIGFIGDILVRIRANQEQMLFYLKARHYRNRPASSD